MQAIQKLEQIEYVDVSAAVEIPIRGISPAGDAELAALERQRIEHSLAMLEEMQSSFRRGREAVAPYLDSAYAALERLEAVDPQASLQHEERDRMLETCAALERLMRMWEKSRGYVSSCAGTAPDAGPANPS